MTDLVKFSAKGLVSVPDRNLAAVHEEACTALQEMGNTINLYDRHNSDAQNALIVAGEYTPARKLRQIAAELQRRQGALAEAYASLRKKSIKAQIKRREAANEDDVLKKELLEAQADKLETQCALTERPYHGALMSVLKLKEMHDGIMEELKEKYGEITDEVMEKEEARYFIKRIFSQSLRNIRMCDRIQDGNQFVLSRMGFDPASVEHMLTDWLNERLNNNDIGSGPEEEFLELCANKFESIVQPRLGYVERSE